MIGYDNAAGRCISSPGLERGHWYLSNRRLYIVPDPAHGHAEIEGPDDELADQLAERYRGTAFEDVEPFALATELAIEFAPDWMRRFDERRGYFTA